jgi:hypothetical protein
MRFDHIVCHNGDNRLLLTCVWENIEKSFIQVKDVKGKRNLSYLFTKENKDAAHFIHIRDFICNKKEDFCKSIVSSRGSVKLGLLFHCTLTQI